MNRTLLWLSNSISRLVSFERLDGTVPFKRVYVISIDLRLVHDEIELGMLDCSAPVSWYEGIEASEPAHVRARDVVDVEHQVLKLSQSTNVLRDGSSEEVVLHVEYNKLREVAQRVGERARELRDTRPHIARSVPVLVRHCRGEMLWFGGYLVVIQLHGRHSLVSEMRSIRWDRQQVRQHIRRANAMAGYRATQGFCSHTSTSINQQCNGRPTTHVRSRE